MKPISLFSSESGAKLKGLLNCLGLQLCANVVAVGGQVPATPFGSGLPAASTQIGVRPAVTRLNAPGR